MNIYYPAIMNTRRMVLALMLLTMCFLSGCISVPTYENCTHWLKPIENSDNGRLLILSKYGDYGIVVDYRPLRPYLIAGSCTFVDLTPGEHLIQIVNSKTMSQIAIATVEIPSRGRKLLVISKPKKGEETNISLLEFSENDGIDEMLMGHKLLLSQRVVRLRSHAYVPVSERRGNLGEIVVESPWYTDYMKGFGDNAVLGESVYNWFPRFKIITSTPDSIIQWVQSASVAELERTGFTCRMESAEKNDNQPRIRAHITKVLVEDKEDDKFGDFDRVGTLKLSFIVLKPGKPDQVFDVIGEYVQHTLNLITLFMDDVEYSVVLNATLQDCFRKGMPKILAALQ